MRYIIIIFVALILYPGISSGNSWNNLIKAIIKIESNGDSLAINKKDDSVGILQIRPIMIREVNRIVGSDKYELSDRLDSLKSIEIFNVYQQYHNPSLNHRRACKLWNGGSSYFKNPNVNSKSEIYYNRVLNELKKIENVSNSAVSNKSN